MQVLNRGLGSLCMGLVIKEAKENQDKFPTLYWLPKLHKNPIQQNLLLILVLVRQQNFLNC